MTCVKYIQFCTRRGQNQNRVIENKVQRQIVVFELSQFWKCSEVPDKSIDAFLTTLRLRAETCEFDDQKESPFNRRNH